MAALRLAFSESTLEYSEPLKMVNDKARKLGALDQGENGSN